jgi:hypothetical protein
MDFWVPSVPRIAYFWSLVEIFLAIKILGVIWRKKTSPPGWFNFLAATPDEAAKNFFFQLSIIALLLDGFRVGFGLGFFGPQNAPYMETLNPTWWSLVLVSSLMALCLAGGPLKRKFLLVVLGVILAHQLVLWLGKDIFVARFQLIVYLLLAITGSDKLFPRLGLIIFAILAFFGEPRFLSLDFFQNFDYPWLDPKTDQLDAAYESLMGQAAMASSGRWGLGLAYWPKLELLRPGLLSVNSLVYLTVWLGVLGTGAYIFLQSLFYFVLIYKIKDLAWGWPKVLILATTSILTLGVLLTLLATLSLMGGYDPVGLAFVGSNQVGALALGVTYFAVAGHRFFQSSPPEALKKPLTSTSPG